MDKRKCTVLYGMTKNVIAYTGEGPVSVALSQPAYNKASARRPSLNTFRTNRLKKVHCTVLYGTAKTSAVFVFCGGLSAEAN